MTNSVDTWETLTLVYANSTGGDSTVTVRTVAKNASGSVFFDPVITVLAPATYDVYGTLLGYVDNLEERLTADRASKLDYLDATISSRLASAGYTAPLDAAGTRSAVGLASANLDTQLSTIDGVVDAILADTGTDGVVVAAGSKTGYSISGTITTLDALDTAQDSQHSTTQSAIAALNNLSAAQVNAEVVDALATDTYPEPGQGSPGATLSIAAKINYIYKTWRNKKTNDGSTTNLYADDGTTVDQKQTTSESGGTVTKSEWTTGA